jgi:hypothetical protein
MRGATQRHAHERSQVPPTLARSSRRSVLATMPKRKSDALALARKGGEFEVVVDLDIGEYGVDSVAVRMKKNMLTELTECLALGCRNSTWCKGSSSNAMFFAVKHVNSYHLPDKIVNGVTAGKVIKPSSGMTSFFSPVPAPQKTDKHSAMRARDSVCDMTVEPHSPVDDDNGAPVDLAQATPTADADAPAQAAVW